MSRINKSSNSGNSELALAFDNVIQLVDIARNDIIELDKMLKTGVNGQPSVLIDIDRLKHDLSNLENELKEMNETCEDLYASKADTTDTEDHEKRIKYLEKIVWIGLGGISVIGIVVTYGASVLKILKEFFTVTPIG